MRTKAGKILAVGIFSMFLTAMECSAQLVSSFETLRVLVKPGDNIYVTDTAGVTTRGRIEELSSSSLGLIVKGKRRDLAQTDVREIRQWRRDPIKNGAQIGAATAAAGGLTLYLALDKGGLCDCRTDFKYAVAGIAIATGLGAGIGAGFDALIRHKQTIFRNSNRSAGKLQMRPILNRSDKGVKVAFSF